MKSTLRLKKETIRQLTPDELQDVEGARLSIVFSYSGATAHDRFYSISGDGDSIPYRPGV